MITDPQWAEVFDMFWTRRIAGVHTSMPAVVRAYDESTALAEVQPAIRWNGKDLPVLKDVRVAHPAGGGYSITFPLEAGDEVQLIFEEVDPGNHLETGDVEDPRTLRRHGFTAIAVPVRKPGGTPPPHEAGKLVIASTDARLVLDSAAAYLGGSAGADFVALAAKVNANFQAIKDLFNGWTPVPNDGGAALKTAAGSLVFDGVAATKGKAL